VYTQNSTGMQWGQNKGSILGESQSAQVVLPQTDRIVCITVRSDTGAFLPCNRYHLKLQYRTTQLGFLKSLSDSQLHERTTRN